MQAKDTQVDKLSPELHDLQGDGTPYATLCVPMEHDVRKYP